MNDDNRIEKPTSSLNTPNASGVYQTTPSHSFKSFQSNISTPVRADISAPASPVRTSRSMNSSSSTADPRAHEQRQARDVELKNPADRRNADDAENPSSKQGSNFPSPKSNGSTTYSGTKLINGNKKKNKNILHGNDEGEGSAYDDYEKDEMHANIKNPIDWLRFLSHMYGYKFMVTLICVQHLCKGLVGSMASMPVQFIYKEYHIPGPQIQIFRGTAMLPWAMKPIMGLLSDTVPIFGFRKLPYMLLAILVGFISCFLVAISSSATVPVQLFVASIFGLQFFMSNTDLLTEAAYAKQIRLKPKYGPDLMTFVWGGLHSCSLLAICIAPVAMGFGLRFPYFLCLVPIVITAIPVSANYLQEQKMTSFEKVEANAKLFKQPECFALCVVMFLGTCTLSGLGILYENIELNAFASIALGIFLLVAFQIVFPPTVAYVNAFFLIQSSMSLQLGGATFYFYTDDEKAYPDGPHFTMEFYTGVLGVAGAICSILGIMFYQRYLKDATYRSLLLGVNVLFAGLSMLDVLFYLRWNKRMGINDHFFVLGASVFESIVDQWMWMPGIVILSQLVQPGMEATMYALLAGCHNLGNSISSNAGALLLKHYGIDPQGKEGDGPKFDNLWWASIISTALPLATCVLIPYMLPDAKQSEKLVIENELSPYQNWMGINPHEKRYSGISQEYPQRSPSQSTPQSTPIGQKNTDSYSDPVDDDLGWLEDKDNIEYREFESKR